MRRSTSVLAALALVAAGILAAAGPASAKSYLLGSGTKPSVAVGRDGTAHVAWNVPTANAAVARLRYCRIPKGATACAAFLDLGAPAAATTPPRVFVRGKKEVFVASGRCCYSEQPPVAFPGVVHTVMFVSEDGGTTWPPQPRSIGTLDPGFDGVLAPTAAAPLSPSWSFLALSGYANDGQFQLTPFSPTQNAGDNLAAIDPGGRPVRGAIGLARFDAANAADARPVAVFDDGTRTVVTRFRGAQPLPNYNTAGQWAPPAPVGSGMVGGLAGGPSGLHLLLNVFSPKGYRLLVRRWSKGAVFGKATRLTSSDEGEIFEPDLFQDASGRLLAVWRRNRPAPDQLRYASAPKGGEWSKPATLATRNDLFDLEVATTKKGKGVVVWDENKGTDDRVLMTRLG